MAISPLKQYVVDSHLGFYGTVVIRNTKNGPKIIDLQIENASLIITFRSEFMSLLKKSGGDFDEFIEVIVERTLKLEKTAQNSQQNPQAAAQ
jgi:ABC-type transporter MlaC component